MLATIRAHLQPVDWDDAGIPTSLCWNTICWGSFFTPTYELDSDKGRDGLARSIRFSIIGYRGKDIILVCRHEGMLARRSD